jgi:putative transposase
MSFALCMRTPAAVYRPSPRPMPAKLPAPAYPGHDPGRRVRHAGTFRVQKRQLFLSATRLPEDMGREETGDGIWSIHCYNGLLAQLDARDCMLDA